MIRLKRLYANNFKQLQEIDLHFPDAARILVQGKNEAGKSTLFEAVYFALFGAALATETGGRGLDSLIAYGTEKALVELDFRCDDRLFKVTRTVIRDKSNVWELEVVRDGQPPEEIRGNTAVNKRLIAELGFDGEALLNTCFVEQKKLEKLEGLGKAKREESLAKLLNLDAMVDVENDLKIRAEDKQELDRLQKRADLAEIQNVLPEREKELQTVDGKLKLIDLRGTVQGATAELQTVQKLEGAIGELMARRQATARQVERIDALKEGMQNVKAARDTAERLAENASESERLQAERAEAQSALAGAPQLETRRRALRQLSNWLRRLGGIRAAADTNDERVTQLASAQARFVELNETVAREEQTQAQLEGRLHQYEVGDALGDWIVAQNGVAARRELESGIREKQSARDRLARRLRLEVYALAVLVLILAIAAAIQPIAAVLLVVAAVGALVYAARLTWLWRDLARVAQQLGQAEGQAQAQATANAAQVARVQEAGARLVQLGAPIPASPEAAQSRRLALASEIAATKEELLAEQLATRERLVQARAVLQELGTQHGLDATNTLQRDLEHCRQVANKAQAILARWQDRVQALAAGLDVQPAEPEISRALYQVDAQAQEIERRARDRARLEQEIARRQQQADALAVQTREAYTRAREFKPGAPEWSLAMTVADYNALGKELRAEYDALGGDAILKQAREVEGELGRRQGEHDTHARNVAVLIARTQELLAGIGRPDELAQSPQVEELLDLQGRLEGMDLGDEAALRLRERELVGLLHSLRDRQSRLERELGLEGELLDPAAAHAEFQNKARETLVRERGVEIMTLARRRIVQKVLPATMDYMRRILPTLTRDRYHDAQLDPESYKIQVWDERAGQGGAFKEKNIFSGGTKDQFSLALRLAFALATLPQERGSAPSFIFLDEPLSSFDEERADALIYLLTEGEIARAFEQIFLISHVHVDERLFTHRVILENGRVQFSDLPRE